MQENIEYIAIALSPKELVQVKRAANRKRQTVHDYLRDRALKQHNPELPNI